MSIQMYHDEMYIKNRRFKQGQQTAFFLFIKIQLPYKQWNLTLSAITFNLHTLINLFRDTFIKIFGYILTNYKRISIFLYDITIQIQPLLSLDFLI